jgi:hypothetical protein
MALWASELLDVDQTYQLVKEYNNTVKKKEVNLKTTLLELLHAIVFKNGMMQIRMSWQHKQTKQNEHGHIYASRVSKIVRGSNLEK